jgi:alpha-methylacyl-CoA racemase
MGPLGGVKVIELAGIGPGPFCAMVLSDLGAEVIRIDRKTAGGGDPRYQVLNRGRRSMGLDLKRPEAVAAVLRMVERAEALIEGFRPGVMERLGLGPEVCHERNPALVYGRMTGWGQDGPLAQAAGHDINYIALAGALHAIGPRNGKPVPPLNLIGDFGGGGMLLALGVVCGLFEAQRSGKGQVIDAAMVDGSALLMASIYGMKAMGAWTNDRGSNMLDSGAHFYDTYTCADGECVSVGAIEPQFYALLREKAGLEDTVFEAQMDREKWPELKSKIAEIFKSKTRDEWCTIMEGSDVCFAPVLNLDEVLDHPHNRARQTFVEVSGVPQPAPAPRFSRTVPEIQRSPPRPGENTEEALADWGFSAEEIAGLREGGAI